MRLDGTIANTPVGLTVLAVFVVLGNWFERRWNPMPPRERYQRDPNRVPIVAFWNLFDERRWTAEGIAFHRRRMVFAFWAVLVFGCGWLLLDSIW
jgi:hypothetical protein